MNQLFRLWINLAFYFLLILLIEHTHKYIESNKQAFPNKFKQPLPSLIANNLSLSIN